MVCTRKVETEEVESRTFVFVRGPDRNIENAEVVFVNDSGERWLFPETNEGGWTKRLVPDGKYAVTVSAKGWKTRIAKLRVPSGDRYEHRTYIVHLVRPER